MSKKKYKGKLPYFEQRIETPHGKGRLVIASAEWSSTDKKATEKVGQMLRRAFGIKEKKP